MLLPLIGGGAGAASIAFAAVRGGITGLFKPYLLLGIALICASAVAYHFIVKSDLQSDLASSQAEAYQLKRANDQLQESNRSLEASIARQREVGQQILAELTNVRASDERVRAELTTTQNALRDAERRAQLARIRDSDRVDLLVNAINRDMQCRMQNFGKDGECRNGVFRPRSQ